MKKEERKLRRRMSIRKRVTGTAERPRLCLHKSSRNLYAQVIDDFAGKTLCGLSSLSKSVKVKFKNYSNKNKNAATVLGEEIAKMAAAKGIKKVVFDRLGCKYHGVVKLFADTARKNGLEF